MMKLLLFTLAIIFTVTPASADPVTIVVSAISAAFTAATTTATFWAAFATTMALAGVSRLLAPDPDEGFTSGATGYLTSAVAAAADHQIIYGQQRVGGIVVYKETTNNNQDLHIVIALAGHEIEAIQAIYANDEQVSFQSTLSETLTTATAPAKYAEKTRQDPTYDDEGTLTGYETVVEREAAIYAAGFVGTDDQVAAAELVSASEGKWSGDHTLSGVAYVYIKLKFIADAFPNGEPEFTALVQGKKVYNPNTSVTEYSDNVALCLRDYLKSDYGMNAQDDEIDDTSFITAANICDETVGLSIGGNETRYRMNAAFTTGTTPQTVIDNMVRSMAGSLWYSQGLFRVKAGKYVAPVISLNEDDLRSNVQIRTRRSRRENFNAVVGTFRGLETNWIKSDYPKVASSTFVDVDGGEENITNLDLLYTPTSTMAQRVAKILLYRNREQVTVSASFGLKAFQLQVGDVVKFSNNRAGWAEKAFEVISWSFEPSPESGLIVNLGLQETSAAVYDWNAEEDAFETNNTNLESGFFVPPLGLSTNVITRIINEHVLTVLQVDVTTSLATQVDYAVVEYRPLGDTDYTQMGKGELGLFEAIDIQNGYYEVRAQGVNTFGVKGDYTQALVQVQALIESPADVTNFNASVSGGFTTLEWNPVPDLDLSFYGVRHAVEETDAEFADATDSVVKVARPATSVVVPARAGSYMIRAYDKLGIPSQNFSTVVVTDQQLDDYATTVTLTEDNTFDGAKTGCSVVSSKLRLTSPVSADTTATYVFDNDTDVGSVRRVRATGVVKVARADDTAGLFDDLTGDLDTLAGDWDDLTANPQNADTNVVFYIRHADQALTGTPVWSDWKPFKSGDFSGRSFQFKVELISKTDDVTPNISELSAKVEYN